MKNNGKIIMLRGLPASGKSTKANMFMQENYNNINIVRINRSTLRNMLWPQHKWSIEYEAIVKEIEYNMVSSLIYSGYNVIIDSTNLSDGNIKKWRKLTKKLEVIDLRDISLETCLERDSKRKDNQIGPKIIIELARLHGLLK